jgi:hypothetical protein
VTQKWNTKRYVIVATVVHAIMEELSEAVFYVWFAPAAA